MPVPQLGSEPVAPQVYQSQSVQQQLQQQHQSTRQQPQQKEHYPSGTIHARHRRKIQETMQKQGHTGTFQRH